MSQNNAEESGDGEDYHEACHEEGVTHAFADVNKDAICS